MMEPRITPGEVSYKPMYNVFLSFESISREHIEEMVAYYEVLAGNLKGLVVHYEPDNEAEEDDKL